MLSPPTGAPLQMTTSCESPHLRSSCTRLVLLLILHLLQVSFAQGSEADGAAGRRLMASFQCNRCHDGLGPPNVPLDKHCTHCHQSILSGVYPAAPETLRSWQSRLHSINAVPSLLATGARLRREWIESFLLKPHDLRPELPAMMPRLALTPIMAKQIAVALVPTDLGVRDRPLPLGQAPSGRILLDSLHCGVCHRFSGVPPLVVNPNLRSLITDSLPQAAALAPDLRFVRDRWQPQALHRWLQAPEKVKPDTLMPSAHLTEQQAADLIAYLLTAPLTDAVVDPPIARLPILTRKVSFDEVNEHVFRRTCWHCHSTPEFAGGDGGPGNTGGFGFKGRGFNVTTYADVASGVLDSQGERRSVFLPLADGTPRLLAVLLARHRELRGEQVKEVRGMPLGLPPLSAEQIQLVESWIAQGRPQ